MNKTLAGNGSFVPVSNEEGVQIVQEMKVLNTKQMEGVILYWGQHESHGSVLAIEAAFGETILFSPFDHQS